MVDKISRILNKQKVFEALGGGGGGGFDDSFRPCYNIQYVVSKC